MVLAVEMLEFRDSRVVLIVGEVHHRRLLIPLRVPSFEPEGQAPVREPAERVVKEGIDPPGVDQPAERFRCDVLGVACVQADGDVRMVDYAFAQGGESLFGQPLIRIGKIACVPVVSDRQAFCYFGRELLRIEPPLLLRVIFEEQLVEFLAYLRDDDVFGVFDPFDSDPSLFEIGAELFGREGTVKELLHGVEIDGQGNRLAIDFGQHTMDVAVPFGELAEIVPHVFLCGMEDVRPILLDEQTLFVVAIRDITPDVATAIHQQHRLAQVATQSFGQHAPGQPRSSNKGVIHLRETVSHNNTG